MGNETSLIPFARERGDSNQSSTFRLVASPNECLKRKRGFCCSWPFGKSFPLTSHAGTYFQLTGRFEGAGPYPRFSTAPSSNCFVVDRPSSNCAPLWKRVTPLCRIQVESTTFGIMLALLKSRAPLAERLRYAGRGAFSAGNNQNKKLKEEIFSCRTQN